MDSFKSYIKEEIEGNPVVQTVPMATDIRFVGRDCAKDCPFSKVKGKFTRDVCYWPGEIYKLKEDPENPGFYLRHEDCLEFTKTSAEK
jgi:hypothetical protein